MADKKIYKIPVFNITLFTKSSGSPNIYYSFSLNKQLYRGTCKTSNLETAQQFAVNRYLQIKEGKIENNLSFEEITKKFLRFKEKNVAPLTMRKYRNNARFLTKFFKKYPIEDIKTNHLLKYQSWREDYYKKPNDEIRNYEDRNMNCAINAEIKFLRGMIGFANDYLNIKTNVPKFKLLKENRREKILTRSEYLLLVDYFSMGKGMCFFANIIRFLNGTGLRWPSEVLSLKWKDIHLDKGYLQVIGKGSKKRSVPLVGTAKKVLIKLLERDVPKGKDDFVFLDDNGKTIKGFFIRWKNALQDLGIDDDITLYGFRHLYTTRMLRRPDINIKFIADALGHTNLDLLQKHYGHLKIDDLIKIMERSEKNKTDILRKRLIENDLRDEERKKLENELIQEKLFQDVFGEKIE